MKNWTNSELRFHRMEREELHNRLKRFLDDEARLGSMDFGCVTPLYVYRMWGGNNPIDEIAAGLRELRKQGFMNMRL